MRPIVDERGVFFVWNTRVSNWLYLHCLAPGAADGNRLSLVQSTIHNDINFNWNTH